MPDEPAAKRTRPALELHDLELPALTEVKNEATVSEPLHEPPSDIIKTELPWTLDEQIEQALSLCDENLNPCTESGSVYKTNTSLRSASPEAESIPTGSSLFEDAFGCESAVSSPPQNEDKNGAPVNLETVALLKQSMASHSRLVGTFTVLKSTYLKLCREFNFLLGKFNENERIKIELIHENNELRRLLWETIHEKELDRRQYRSARQT